MDWNNIPEDQRRDAAVLIASVYGELGRGSKYSTETGVPLVAPDLIFQIIAAGRPVEVDSTTADLTICTCEAVPEKWRNPEVAAASHAECTVHGERAELSGGPSDPEPS